MYNEGQICHWFGRELKMLKRKMYKGLHFGQEKTSITLIDVSIQARKYI